MVPITTCLIDTDFVECSQVGAVLTLVVPRSGPGPMQRGWMRTPQHWQPSNNIQHPPADTLWPPATLFRPRPHPHSGAGRPRPVSAATGPAPLTALPCSSHAVIAATNGGGQPYGPREPVALASHGAEDHHRSTHPAASLLCLPLPPEAR